MNVNGIRSPRIRVSSSCEMICISVDSTDVLEAILYFLSVEHSSLLRSKKFARCTK